MTTAEQFITQGLAAAEREMLRAFKQWQAQGFPPRGPAETYVISAGQHLRSWKRLRAGFSA